MKVPTLSIIIYFMYVDNLCRIKQGRKGMKNGSLTRYKILEILSEAKKTGIPISGSKIAESLSISRNAVWKAIKSLKSEGYKIKSEQSIGYSLIDNIDILSKEKISSNIEDKSTKIIILNSTSSTNSYAKNIEKSDCPIVVIANEQTGGRGRFGRTFLSPKGSGIYMSYVFKPLFPLNEILKVTPITALLVLKTIKEVTGVDVSIKWVNDIYKEDRKVTGILTESIGSLDTGNVEHIVIGIGINCFKTSIPLELENTIGFLTEEKEPSFTRNEIIFNLINILNKTFSNKETLTPKMFINDYRKNCFIIGKKVKLIRPGKENCIAKVENINDNFELVATVLSGTEAGKHINISSGEVSIKF